MAQDQITTTKQAITAAFEDWENAFRKNPSEFMTEAEQAAIEVAPLSEARAIYFCALLRSADTNKTQAKD